MIRKAALALAAVIVEKNNTIFIFIYIFSPFLSQRQTPGVIFVRSNFKMWPVYGDQPVLQIDLTDN